MSQHPVGTLSPTSMIVSTPLLQALPTGFFVASSIPSPYTDPDAGEDPDGDLVRGLLRGEEPALGAIYDRHGSTLYTLAVAILREEADAEEVVADVFTRLWRNPGAYDPDRGSLGAFLTVMTRTRALDTLRSRRRRLGAEERAAEVDESGIATPLGEATPLPDQDVERKELRSQLETALGVLPEPQREVITLAYFYGYTQSEIAARLAEPLGTVKTRTRTAMAKLRHTFDPGVEDLA